MQTNSIKSTKAANKEQAVAKALAKALEVAFKDVNCDLRCFDWLSYNPDFHIAKEQKMAV